MSYIAFLDMLGTRNAALVNSETYFSAIESFRKALNSARDSSCKQSCRIYGYSDNAYIETELLEDMIAFFRNLRILLMEKHLYFSAAIESGKLGVKIDSMKKQGCSMIFSSKDAVNVYLSQCGLSGIGISISESVAEELEESSIVKSVFVPKTDSNECIPIKDLSYGNVSFALLKCVISDYISTAVMYNNAAKNYITPIISMIKCLSPTTLINEMDSLVREITFTSIPKAFYTHLNHEHTVLFVFALFDYVLSLYDMKPSFDSQKACEKIVVNENNLQGYVNKLPLINTSIISVSHKKALMQIFYNMKVFNWENTN